MSDILEKILATKTEEVAAARKARPLASLRNDAETVATSVILPVP